MYKTRERAVRSPARDRSGGDRLQAFVLTTAPAVDLAAATGGDVVALAPGNPLALVESVALGHPGGPVLVVGTKGQEALVRTQATFAAARWPDLQVAWRAVPMTALALANAAAGAARSALSPTLAVRSFDLTVERAWSCVWLRSVAGLQEPSPGIGQHLRSWFPGPGFLIVHRPRPRIVPVPRVTQEPPVAVDARSVLLVGAVSAPQVTASVMAMAGTAAMRNVPSIVDAKARYGTDHAVEFAGVALVDHELAPPVTGECRSCSLPLATAVCPFCHAAAGQPDPVRRTG